MNSSPENTNQILTREIQNY